MAEVLTREIAKEYLNRARKLPTEGMQDIGKRRELRIELQKRCDLTELQAVNIINGLHVRDYISICERREKNEREQQGQSENQDNRRLGGLG